MDTDKLAEDILLGRIECNCEDLKRLAKKVREGKISLRDYREAIKEIFS